MTEHIDVVQHPVLRKCLEHLWADQGLSLSQFPKVFLIAEMGSNDIAHAVRWLRTLPDEELETFCVGEQETEMKPMVEQATDREGAEAAHRVLDIIFEGVIYGDMGNEQA